jgi:DNA-binding transcriptional LysR family regulator
MELRELHAFVAVLEEGAITAAARRLHLSQSTLSHTISGLERELGLTLVVRTHAGVEATEAGMALLHEARGVLARYEGALQTMAGFKAHGGGVIRLGIPAEMPPDLIPGALAQFRERCPDVRVVPGHLSTAAQLGALSSGRLDVGLVTEHPDGARLDSLLIAREEIGVLLAATPGSDRAGPDAIRLEALTGLQWVGFPRSSNPAWYDEITAVLRSYGITVGPAPPEDQQLIPAVKFAGVAAGQAFALAAEIGGPPLPAGVTWHPIVGNPLVRRTWVVWPLNSRRRDIGHLVDALEAAGQD